MMHLVMIATKRRRNESAMAGKLTKSGSLVAADWFGTRTGKAGETLCAGICILLTKAEAGVADWFGTRTGKVGVSETLRAGICILLTKAEAAFATSAGTRRRAIENSYTAKLD
jgi:hypothetical protein